MHNYQSRHVEMQIPRRDRWINVCPSDRTTDMHFFLVFVHSRIYAYQLGRASHNFNKLAVYRTVVLYHTTRDRISPTTPHRPQHPFEHITCTSARTATPQDYTMPTNSCLLTTHVYLRKKCGKQ